jgi:hypothetical protein
MGVTRTQVVSEFETESDSGDRYVVQVCRDFFAVLDRGRFSGAERGGDEYMRTADGRAVRFLGSRRYEIEGDPTTVVTSEDPKAP